MITKFNKITDLEDSVSIGDEELISLLCNEIISFSNERNRKLRFSYHKKHSSVSYYMKRCYVL